MEFKDRFVEKYRIALHAARDGDTEGVINGLYGLYSLFEEQYKKNNGDSIVVKVKLSYWQDVFGKYIAIARKYGLSDRRLQKLFGLVTDDDIPSFSDIMRGKAADDGARGEKVPVGGATERGVPAFDGLMPPSEAQSPDAGEEKGPPDTEKGDPSLPSPIIPSEDGVPDAPAGGVAEAGKEGGGRDVPAFTPQSLGDFIGQQHIVSVIMKEIAIAKNEGRKHLDNILLFGAPGLGKTTLMELIAKELGVKFELLDCSQFRNSQQSLKALQNFFMRVARDNEPVVIALDEVHMLNNELQSSLLTLLNSRVYVSPLDVNGQCKRIPIEEFTFIAATTDDDKVLDTIKNRCLRLKFQMVDYTAEELKRIYRNKVAAKGLTISEEAIDACVPRSRGAIRYVNSIVEGLNTALYNNDGVRMSTHIDLQTALGYFEAKGIDPIGLEAKDLEILRTIQEDTSGAISADVLSARVGLDTRKYLSEYERYLIKIGFISVSGRGRSLTEKAIKYLNGSGEKKVK